MCATSVILKKTTRSKQPPNGRKFAQSGHPVLMSALKARLCLGQLFFFELRVSVFEQMLISGFVLQNSFDLLSEDRIIVETPHKF
jgi:hypothetical protein